MKSRYYYQLECIFLTFHVYFVSSEVYLNIFDNISINCTYRHIQLAISPYKVSIPKLIYYKK